MENNQRNSRKRLNSLILLVAFTAVMLIVSTYAWFSTQKNVSLSGIKGTVKVAEGLQISLDASIWKNEIDFSAFTDGANSTSTEYFAATGATLGNPLAGEGGNTNVIPTELLPASTTGAYGDTTINMYRGLQEEGNSLTDIALINELTDAKAGFYAIDLYLQNSSAGTDPDNLQIEENSAITIATEKASTGLQNAVRVALAITPTDVPVDGVKGQSDILTAAAQKTIKNVTIWEPNANIHSTYVQKNMRLATAYDSSTKKYTWGDYISATEQHSTYAVNSTAAVDNEETTDIKENVIDNVYYWASANDKLTATKTVQTLSTGVTKQNLTDASTGSPVTIPASTYVKARMYIWLEGQDVDCINQASYGGGVTVDFGFSKPGTQTNT